VGGSGGSAGTVSGSGGSGGNGATSGVGGVGGSGGNGGVVSGGDGGMSGGVGGMAGNAGDAETPMCMTNDNCDADRPVCNSEGQCSGCDATTSAVCGLEHNDLDLCNSVTGACVECLDDDNCAGTATPECFAGRCEECETHADCDSDLENPQCNSDHVCVPCTADEDACSEHGDLDMCDIRDVGDTQTKGQCVQCLVHSDCPNETPQCNSAGRCVACSETVGDITCLAREDDDGVPLLKCNTHPDRATTGQCVQCIDDIVVEATSTVCGSNSCNQGLGRCTTTAVESVVPCGECVADSECDTQPDLKCIEYAIDGVSETKSYCFYDRAHQGGTCASGLKPFRNSVEATSVDGYEANYCLISTASCEAFLDALDGKDCDANAMCGLGNPLLDTAICLDSGGGAECTYACTTSEQCPMPQPDCVGAGSVRYCR
jgi:hypothetical protein